MFRNKGSVIWHSRGAKKTFEFFTTKSSVRKDKDVYHRMVRMRRKEEEERMGEG